MVSSANNSDHKNCVACFESIDIRATKCRYCGQFQNWRRFLNFSATILALLIALISVITAAIPILQHAMTPVDSHILIRISYIEKGVIGLMYTNQGVRQGHLGKGVLEINLPKDTFQLEFANTKGSFVRPQEVNHVDYQIDHLDPEELSQLRNYLSSMNQEYQVEAQLIFPIEHFDGSKNEERLRIAPKNLKKLLRQNEASD